MTATNGSVVSRSLNVDETFGALGCTLHVLKIDSVATLMMLSPMEMRLIPGIGKGTVGKLAQGLADHNLPQREMTESMRNFMKRAFGSIEDTPIAALAVSATQGPVRYEPIDALSALDKLFPGMTIGDLLNHTGKELAHMIVTHENYDRRMGEGSLAYGLRNLNGRLRHLDPELCLGAYKVTSR